VYFEIINEKTDSLVMASCCGLTRWVPFMC